MEGLIRAGGGRRGGSGESAGLDGGIGGFAGADPDSFLDREYEDLAVTDFARAGGFDDGVDGIVDLVLVQDEFDFDFREEVDRVLAGAVDFGLAFLAAEAFDLGHGHADDAEIGQGFFDFGELERFDNGFNFFHVRTLVEKSTAIRWRRIRRYEDW